jgi:5-(carboxyamino)imidazole ribonucleotide mutase
MNDSNEIRVTFAKTIQIMANIGVIMGSISDWETMKECCELLDHFEVKYNKQVVSAHRTPDVMFDYASKAVENGLKIIIAAAGGAAHLPGMVAAKTTLPVIGVPIQSKTLNGIDSLLSIVQMPAGIPVATVAIGSAGAKNAALLAIQILATQDKVLQEKLIAYRKKMEQEAMSSNEKLHQS